MSRRPPADGGTDPEAVLRQTFRALAGGGPAAPADRGERDRARAPRGSDRRWLLLVGVVALMTGLVLGVGSLWVY